MGVEVGAYVAFAGFQVEAVAVVGTFDGDSVERAAHQRRGFFVRAGVEDGVILPVDIKQGDSVLPDLHPFPAARGDFRDPGSRDIAAHPEVSMGSASWWLQSHQDPS